MLTCSDTPHASLTADEKLKSLIYEMLLHVNIYRSYKLWTNSPVFWSTMYIHCELKNTL